jgi:Ankyrin repeats (many copies)
VDPEGICIAFGQKFCHRSFGHPAAPMKKEDKIAYGVVALTWCNVVFGAGVGNLYFGRESFGSMPSHWTPIRSNADVATFLRTNKAYINARNANGNSILHWAAINGNNDVAELLLTNNADINAGNNNGNTPLHSGR